MSYVSTDPFVATLFAVECRNHGAAAVLVIARHKFPTAEVEDHQNPIDAKLNETFNSVECAVQLAASPAELEEQADLVIDVDLAIKILGEMGFTGIPVRLASRDDLNDALFESRETRLSTVQLRTFVARVREELG